MTQKRTIKCNTVNKQWGMHKDGRVWLLNPTGLHSTKYNLHQPELNEQTLFFSIHFKTKWEGMPHKGSTVYFINVNFISVLLNEQVSGSSPRVGGMSWTAGCQNLPAATWRQIQTCTPSNQMENFLCSQRNYLVIGRIL